MNQPLKAASAQRDSEEEGAQRTAQTRPDAQQRYPDYLMDFPPSIPPQTAQRWRQFFDLREDLLLGYGYQTARAYYADLQDIFEWAVAREKDVLALTEADMKQYCALLRRRKYSESTIRRRRLSWNKLQERVKPSTSMTIP